MNLAEHSVIMRPSPRWLRRHACAFLYWLGFLLVLEPGNVFRASQAGVGLVFFDETLRIIVAAFLGTTATPILLMLTRRFPVLGAMRWRHLSLHAAGAAGIAFALIIVSCVLAAWVFEQQWLPTLAEMQDQLINNFLLLMYALLAYTAIAHILLLLRKTEEPETAIPAAQSHHLTRIEVKMRGRLSFLELSAVDWIETQGNYLALHAGSEVHMIRETLIKLEARLDPRRFVRIHRRMIVAIDRIRDIQPVANGDAVLRLGHDCELRASRRYREAIRKCWIRTEQLP